MAKEVFDHAFVVLDRAAFSKIQDMSTWGPDAVICDPWAEKIFDVIALLNIPKAHV
ncbi:hypothetical protein [Legionella cincinnatiensis]|uniref:hypothetical protein n=1 Tax=Legionella cincinnatiensis TaxID=28085 RepID=UPI000B2BBEDC|nr:hypothetical protein [Legionella cincinnatiensis]